MKLKLWFIACLACLSCIGAETPIKDIVARLTSPDKADAEAITEFEVRGVVAARIVLSTNQAVAFVLTPGEAAVPVMASPADAAQLLPRNEITLAGKLGPGPLGAGLLLRSGSVSVIATNRPVGLSEPRGGTIFADASALAGRYVQLTNVTFMESVLGSNRVTKVKGSDGAEVTLHIGHGVEGRSVPSEPVNVFGVVVRSGTEWRLVAARFLLTRAKDLQALGVKRTCLTCHNPDTKLIGPSYRDVAARYRHDSEAVPKLMSQMEKGGTGKWGNVPMPALAATVPVDDRKALAEWVLSYRWDWLLSE